MQLARVQAALEHSTHASEALASAGQATHPRAARASLSPTRTTRPGRPARRSALPDLSCRPVPPHRSRCRAPSMATRMLVAQPVDSTAPLPRRPSPHCSSRARRRAPRRAAGPLHLHWCACPSSPVTFCRLAARDAAPRRSQAAEHH